MMRLVCIGFMVLLVASAGQALGITVTNGDFSAGLTGWSHVGPVTDGGGFALLEEDPVLAVTSLEQQIVIPPGARSFSFDYGLVSTPDGSSGFPFSDGLAASLLDPVTFDPILNTPGFTDYFYEDRNGARSFDPSIVTVSGDRVTLYLHSIPGGTDALLAFDLLGGDDGFATQATVDNVAVSVIPEPLTIVGIPLGLIAVAGYFRRRTRATE